MKRESTKKRGAEPMPGHPIFAALYDRVTKAAEQRWLAAIRKELLEGLRGEVLEVGAGTGNNLAYFPPGVRVTAVEPDPHMLRRGKRKSSSAAVQWRRAEAESLPFEDERFDAAVATLVLCTVIDPTRALSEIRRVLRPGGSFIFIEHVASDHPQWRRVQRWLNPLWRRLGAGCNLDRDTLVSIQKAGFRLDRLEAQLDVRWQPLFYGIARKA